MTERGTREGIVEHPVVRFRTLARGKYLAHHYGRTAEITMFPNGPWIVTDITRPDCRVVIGELVTLKDVKNFLANSELSEPEANN